MHRFRKKQDLKKLEYKLPTTNESQVSTNISSELPLLLPAPDFRTSLILPTLTKRFSVLRRGEKANNNNDTTNDSSKTLPENTSNTNEIKPGRSPLSNLMGTNKEKLTPENPLSTISSIIPVNTSVSTSPVRSSDFSNNNGNNNNQEVLSSARKFYDAANISSVNNNDSYNNENEENLNNKNDKNEIIYEDNNVSPVKNLRRISSNGLLVNPTKDRPKPPRTRPPSISQVPPKYSRQNEFTTPFKNNNTPQSQLSLPIFVQSSSQQISPTENSPRGLSRSANLNNSNNDSYPQPSSPRSPLDKLSEGLYNLKLQSPSNLSPRSPLYNTQNLSQTSLRSFGESSVNDEEEMKSSIKKSPSTNSLRNIEDENIYNSDRASTASTIGSSLRRIRAVKTTDSNTSSNSNNSNSDSVYNEGDDEADGENIRNSSATGIMYLKTKRNDEKVKPEFQPGSFASNMTNIPNITTNLRKNPSRGGTMPPPKPQPPPLSLTDTLIASGQSDIAHQVMAMRRVQNVNQQPPLLPQHQIYIKQAPTRKWSKKNLKNISEPQLVSTSSNVKTIPIVQLDDDKLRKKRESETGIGKSLRRIKDVFISDSESMLFGKKRLSLGPSNENLPRKFVSDESLNQRFINNERRGLDFVKKRAYSTRENGKPDDRLRQDIRNNFTFLINNEQQQLNGDDVYISGDRSSSPIINNDKWTGQQPYYDIDALKRHAEMVARYSSNKKVDNQITSSRPSSRSSSISNTDIPNESESVSSSPISPFSDYPSSTSTPPPISPRNPLRQPDKGRIKNSIGSQNSISDTGSDDKRDSKASSRLMSIFSNRSSKSSSSNSKNSDNNNLQVSQTNNNDDGHNKVIRRTIIITKPYLPPLPEDPAPSAPILPSSSLVSSGSLSRKKKINLDDGRIHVASDGRQWFLSKKTSSDDEKDETESTGSSTLLSIPTQKTSLSDRPPTPLPSPNTRENTMELPYGIPIPPIPSPHRNSAVSKASKRTSKSSIASSLKSSSSRFNRKSVGNKSVHSTYGDSIYDYYYNDDQEGTDEGSDNNSNTTRVQQLETQHVEVLEMSDGSYVWQVVNGLRGEDMEDRYSYYYAGASTDDNGDDYTYSQIWPQDFGRLNYGRDLDDDQLSLNDKQQNNNSHLDYYTADVEPLPKQKHGQYLAPNVLPSSHHKHTDSTASTASSDGEEKFVPRTSVYFAKDVPLPKLLEEMSKGLGGSVDLDEDYVYGGEVGAGGTGVVGETTVEERLDQVMRALGVDDAYMNK